MMHSGNGYELYHQIDQVIYPNYENSGVGVTAENLVVQGKENPSAEADTKFDDKLWCDECGQSLEQECRIHGFYSIIKDKTIPSRARLTMPHQLTVRNLELRAGNNHVYGTFAKKILQKRTRFGPFEGSQTDQWRHQREDRLMLKLFLAKGESTYLDCADENSCNWMIFVRPANLPEEQNTVAFQYKSQIYFVTTKVVSVEDELRVWYAKDYADKMGVDLLSTSETQEPPSPPSPFTESNLHIDEEFLMPPVKKNHKLATEKTHTKTTANTDTALQDESIDNLKTLANIASQTSFTPKKTTMHAMQLPAVATVAPGFVSVLQEMPSVLQSIVSVPQGTLSVPSGTLSVPESNMSANQNTLAFSLGSHSLTSSTLAVSPSTLSVPGGTFEVPQVSTVSVKPAYIQSARIDDAGILTIEEGALASNKATLNVEILTEEVEPMLNKNVESKPAFQEEPMKVNDIFNSGHVELMIDETGTMASPLQSDHSDGHEPLDTDNDEEVEEYIEKPVNTCADCQQNFTSSETYSNHNCRHRKKPGLRKRNVTVKRTSKINLEKSKTVKRKYGYSRKRRGSLTMALNKIITKDEKISVKSAKIQTKLNKESGGVKAESAFISENIIEMKSEDQGQQNRKIKGSRKRKSGVVRKVKPPYFICDRCEMVFSSQEKLQVHSFSHTGEKPFMCPHEGCDKSFVTKFKLKRHVTTHGEGQVFNCAYCDKTFRRKDHLKNHLKVHDPNKSFFTCDICSKQYASTYAFRTHIAFHRAEQGELRCYVCSQVLPTKELLLHHLKVHSGARSVKDPNSKKHPCRVCKKMFYTAKDVRRHEVVHSKEREHMCHLCAHKFGRKDHLVRHIRLAHGKDVEGPLNIENPNISILPPAVKLAKQSKKQTKRKQRSINARKRVTTVSGETVVSREGYSSKPFLLPSLQSQPTVLLPETQLESLNQSVKDEFRDQQNFLHILPNSLNPEEQAQQRDMVPVSELPMPQQVTAPNTIAQSTDEQTYLELQPNDYFQFMISQNSWNAVPKAQPQVLHQMSTQNQIIDPGQPELQAVVPQASLSNPKATRKSRRQKTKTKNAKSNLPNTEATHNTVNIQSGGVINLPVQGVFQNHAGFSNLPGGTNLNLDNISFAGLTTIKPKTGVTKAVTTQLQGQTLNTSSQIQSLFSTMHNTQLTNALGPVFPESISSSTSNQLSNTVEGGTLPVTFLSVNPNPGLSDQLQFYQLVNTVEHDQTNPIPDKSGTILVSQQQQQLPNATQSVVAGHTAPQQIPNSQTEAIYPQYIVSHDSDAVKLFFPEEQKNLL